MTIRLYAFFSFRELRNWNGNLKKIDLHKFYTDGKQSVRCMGIKVNLTATKNLQWKENILQLLWRVMRKGFRNEKVAAKKWKGRKKSDATTRNHLLQQRMTKTAYGGSSSDSRKLFAGVNVLENRFIEARKVLMVFLDHGLNPIDWMLKPMFLQFEKTLNLKPSKWQVLASTLKILCPHYIVTAPPLLSH